MQLWAANLTAGSYARFELLLQLLYLHTHHHTSTLSLSITTNPYHQQSVECQTCHPCLVQTTWTAKSSCNVGKVCAMHAHQLCAPDMHHRGHVQAYKAMKPQGLMLQCSIQGEQQQQQPLTSVTLALAVSACVPDQHTGQLLHPLWPAGTGPQPWPGWRGPSTSAPPPLAFCSS